MIKGLHDIKTHSTLAGEGKLVSVAKNLHKLRDGAGRNNNPESSDWNIKKHIYNKNKGHTNVRQSRVPSYFSDLYLDERIKNHQIRIVKDQLQEMELAKDEGIPVSKKEIERLKARLVQLKVG